MYKMSKVVIVVMACVLFIFANVWAESSSEDLLLGSYGHLFGLKDVRVSGYIDSNYLDQEAGVDTFDNHYFNLIFSSNLSDKIVAEGMIEFEHGGSEFGIPYAQIDYKFSNALILRTGLMVVPFGLANTEYFAGYRDKLSQALRPLAFKEICPVFWGEVGAQLRGRIIEGKLPLSYAIYASNGLEGTEGGKIRDMRGNSQDANHPNKAVGGRLHKKITSDLGVGVSGYTGAYTADGKQDLTITGLDIRYASGPLVVRGEYVAALQQTSADDLNKDGGYLVCAYKILNKYEPVLRYETIALDGAPENDRTRMIVGFNYYPDPGRNVIFRTAYAKVENDGVEKEDDVFMVGLSIGF